MQDRGERRSSLSSSSPLSSFALLRHFLVLFAGCDLTSGDEEGVDGLGVDGVGDGRAGFSTGWGSNSWSWGSIGWGCDNRGGQASRAGHYSVGSAATSLTAMAPMAASNKLEDCRA